MYDLDRPVGVGGWSITCQAKVVFAKLNARRDFLACVTVSEEGNEILICRFCKDAWVPCSRVSCVDVSCMAWSPNDVLAMGSNRGELQVVFRCGEDDSREGGGWSSVRRAFVRPGRRVAAIEFAPRCCGMKLAFACSDGRVLVLEPELEFQPETWRVVGALPTRGGVEVTCLSWRSSAWDDPEAIAVGGDFGVSVFAKCGEANWALAGEKLESQPVRSVSWAPQLGKTHDKIAVGSGNETIVWRVHANESGEYDTPLEFSLEKMLPCGKPVLSVEWNGGGFRLAVKCGVDDIRVWEELPDGAWVCDTKLEGGRKGLREAGNQM
ncbi:hypothetical protein BSKO_06266 [Bryopsis sp. KO-2023]|nr:hypothetical protein BSKO_06266 [Bryopsis sp. KO-2023]